MLLFLLISHSESLNKSSIRRTFSALNHLQPFKKQVNLRVEQVAIRSTFEESFQPSFSSSLSLYVKSRCYSLMTFTCTKYFVASADFLNHRNEHQQRSTQYYIIQAILLIKTLEGCLVTSRLDDENVKSQICFRSLPIFRAAYRPSF